VKVVALRRDCKPASRFVSDGIEECCVVASANVYGPGDVNWSRLVPDTARALVRGERPVIRSDGNPSATTSSSTTPSRRT
jgi:nucleoside-diphosphate-sugar epimerase